MPIIFGEQTVVIQEESYDDVTSFGGLGIGGSEQIDLGSSIYVRFGPGYMGAAIGEKSVAFISAPVEEDTTGVLPPSADPPFPPVWPYPFVGGLIYGREHLGMNINMIREDDFVFSNVIIDEDGDPYDLTGCTLTLVAKWNVRDTDANAVFTCTSDPADGIVVTLPESDGEFTVTVASAKTSSLPLHRVFLPYAVRLTTAVDQIKTVLKGTLRVDPNIVDP